MITSTVIFVFILIIKIHECCINGTHECIFKSEYLNVSVAETKALQSLYNATNGAYWVNKWDYSNIEQKPCNLSHVCCHRTLHTNISYIAQICLSHSNLTGTIPSHIGNFTNLTALHIANNTLFGSIPNEIQYLANLQNLTVANNTLSGSIPHAFSKLKKVIILSFANNNFSAENVTNIFTNFSNLKILSFAHNRFNGTISNNIHKLQRLVYLDLSGNLFSGTIPKTLSQIKSLNMLLMSNLTLECDDISLVLSNLTSLRVVSFSNAPGITGNLSNFICKLKDITILKISDTSLYGTFPKCMNESLSQLKVIELTRNKLTGTLPTFPKTHNISAISVGWNSLTGTISDSYCYLPLKLLTIEHNSFSRLPKCFYYGQGVRNKLMETLEYLDISGNGIESSDTLNLEFTNLLYAFMHKNAFSGKLPIYWQGGADNINNVSLRRLTVHLNKWKDNDVTEWLTHLFDPVFAPNLSIISIYGNSGVMGSIPVIPTNSALKGFFAHDSHLNGSLKVGNSKSYHPPNNLVNVTLFYNALSCTLPKNYYPNRTINWSNTTISVILGNRFASLKDDWWDISSAEMPKWSNPDFVGARNLYITYYDKLQQSAVLIISLVAAIILLSKHCHILRKNESENNYDALLSSDIDHQYKHPFFSKLKGVATLLGSKISIIYVIIMVCLFFYSQHTYECGNYIAKYSMSYYEKMNTPPTLNALICIMAVLYNIGITFSLYKLYVEFLRIDKEFESDNDGLFYSPQLLTPRSKAKQECRDIVWHVLWTFVVIALWIFTCFCVFIYFLTETIPDDNNISFLTPTLLQVTHIAMAAILSFNNIFIIPRVADIILSVIGEIMTCCHKASYFLDNHYKMRSLLIIALRSFTNIVLPIILSIVLLNECGSYWLYFWRGCWNPFGVRNPLPTFQVTINTPYEQSFPISLNGYSYTFPAWRYVLNRDIHILNPEDICGVGFKENLNLEYCMRDFMEYWGSTILLKFVCNLIFPMLYWLKYIFVFKIMKYRDGVLGIARKKFRVDSSYASIISYLEVCIIFGFVIPVLIPLCALVFIINLWVYKRMIKIGRCIPLFQKTYFPVTFLIVSIIFSQITMIVFFYISDYKTASIIVFITAVICDAFMIVGAYQMTKGQPDNIYGNEIEESEEEIQNSLTIRNHLSSVQAPSSPKSVGLRQSISYATEID